MANPKRYFPVSHDLIHDPEMQMMVRSFGAEVYPIWLWMLSGLDRTENKFVIHESAFRELKRVVHKSPQIIEKTVRKLVDIGWISGRKVGDKWEFASPNYRHYHRTRAPNRPPPTYLPSDSSPNPQKDSSKNLPMGPSLRNGHEGELFPQLVAASATTKTTVEKLKRVKVKKDRTLFPQDFRPDERGTKMAEGYGFNAFREAAACIDHHNGIGNKFLDHQATFRTWIRKKLQFAEEKR